MASNMGLFLVANLVLFAAVASASTCSLSSLSPLNGCSLTPADDLCKSTLAALPAGERPLCLCNAIKDHTLTLDGVTNSLTALSFITQLLGGLDLLEPILGLTCTIL